MRFLIFILTVAAVAALGLVAWSFRASLTLENVEAYVQSLGVWGPVAFAAVYALATIAVVPGGFFDALAGALFGPVIGSIVNLAGGIVGAVVAFLIARYGARDFVERRAGPRLRTISAAVDAEGWRFVALVRLGLIFPYNIFNYLLGLTRIPFWQYAVVSIVTMTPVTIAYTWIGYAGRHLAEGAGEDAIRDGLLLLAVIAAALFVPRLIRRRRPAGEQTPS